MGYIVYQGASVVLVTTMKKKADALVKELKNLFPNEQITVKKV